MLVSQVCGMRVLHVYAGYFGILTFLGKLRLENKVSGSSRVENHTYCDQCLDNLGFREPFSAASPKNFEG